MKSLFQKVIAALVLAGPVAAAAQPYPERPISFVVPFAASLKTELTHVSYKGNAPAITDVMSGRIDCIFDQSNELISMRLPLKRINEGFAGMQRGEVVRAVVQINA